MPPRRSVIFLSTVLVSAVLASAQQRDAGDVLARIRAEGLQRSRAVDLYRALTDEIGARLTGSPAHVQAARWAIDRFAEWGLTSPHLEPLPQRLQGGSRGSPWSWRIRRNRPALRHRERQS